MKAPISSHPCIDMDAPTIGWEEVFYGSGVWW